MSWHSPRLSQGQERRSIVKRNLRQQKHASVIKKPRVKPPAREISKEEADATFGASVGGFLGSFAGALAGHGVRTSFSQQLEKREASTASLEITAAIELLIDAKSIFKFDTLPVEQARAKLREAIEEHFTRRSSP